MGNTGDDEVTGRTLNYVHRNNQRVGVAVADSPYGPWTRFDDPVIDISDDDSAADSLCTTNPSICQAPDGTFLLIYKAVGKQEPLPFGGPVVHLAATSTSPAGPFQKHPGLIFAVEGVMFPAEDPFIWHDGERFRAVVKDQRGHFTNAGKSLALFESDNGLSWRASEHPLVSRIRIEWESTGLQQLNSLERPQLYCEDGVPLVLYCAADEDRARIQSYNVHIPLAEVAGTLSTAQIVATGAIVADDLKARFGIENPRLALAGLNPHAGE